MTSPEELIGRVQALEWLLTRSVAEVFAAVPNPRETAAKFQAFCAAHAGMLLDQARTQGDTTEGWTTAHTGTALLTLAETAIHAAGAAMADQARPAN